MTEQKPLFTIVRDLGIDIVAELTLMRVRKLSEGWVVQRRAEKFNNAKVIYAVFNALLCYLGTVGSSI